MNNLPLISVLMPAYNAEKYIGEAIESVLNQTYSNWELIIVNDGSTDKTEEIILSFKDNRIRYIKNEQNYGIGFTRNKAVELAQGIYCAVLDSDDVCISNRFEKQITFLEQHTDYVLCGSWAVLINEKGEKTGRIKNIDNNELLNISLLFSVPLIHSAVMIKSELLKKYKYKSNSSYGEDFDLWLRLANDGLKMANIPQFLIKYRWHDTNISLQYETVQQNKRYELLSPYVQQFIGREVTKEYFDLHQFSFRFYYLGNKEQVVANNLQDEKGWLEFLSKKNKTVKKYNQTDFDAFLWSRWIVCCIFARKIFSVFALRVAWWKPTVIFKTIKLLFYK